MRKIFNTRHIALAIAMLSAVFSASANIPPQPKNANELVYDYANVIDSTQMKVISDSLKALYI